MAQMAGPLAAKVVTAHKLNTPGTIRDGITWHTLQTKSVATVDLAMSTTRSRVMAIGTTTMNASTVLVASTLMARIVSLDRRTTVATIARTRASELRLQNALEITCHVSPKANRKQGRINCPSVHHCRTSYGSITRDGHPDALDPDGLITLERI